MTEPTEPSSATHCPSCGQPWEEYEFGVPSPYCPKPKPTEPSAIARKFSEKWWDDFSYTINIPGSYGVIQLSHYIQSAIDKATAQLKRFAYENAQASQVIAAAHQRGIDNQRTVIEQYQQDMLRITESLQGPSKVSLAAGQIVERVLILKAEAYDRKAGDEPCAQPSATASQYSATGQPVQSTGDLKCASNGPVTSEPEAGPEASIVSKLSVIAQEAAQNIFWKHQGGSWPVCSFNYCQEIFAAIYKAVKLTQENGGMAVANYEFLKDVSNDWYQRLTTEAATLRARVAELERERDETAEAWEQIAAVFPEIQISCDDQIKAAQHIVEQVEIMRAETNKIRRLWDEQTTRIAEAQQKVTTERDTLQEQIGRLIHATGFDTKEQALEFIQEARDISDMADKACIPAQTEEEKLKEQQTSDELRRIFGNAEAHMAHEEILKLRQERENIKTEMSRLLAELDQCRETNKKAVSKYDEQKRAQDFYLAERDKLMAELEQEKGRHATSRDLAESAVARNCQEIDRQRRELERMQSGMLQITQALIPNAIFALTAGQIVDMIKELQELRTKYAKLQEYVREGGDESCPPYVQSAENTMSTDSVLEGSNGPVTSKPEAGPEAREIVQYLSKFINPTVFGYEQHVVAIQEIIDRATATLRARVDELEEQLRDILTKDSVKTREINILTQENNTLRKERNELSAAWQHCRDAEQEFCNYVATQTPFAQVSVFNRDELSIFRRVLAITPVDALAEHDREMRQEVERLKAELVKEREEGQLHFAQSGRNFDSCNIAVAERNHLRQVLAGLMPFVLEDYMPDYATPDYKAAVEAAQEALGQQL